jgi:hypothetical protein
MEKFAGKKVIIACEDGHVWRMTLPYTKPNERKRCTDAVNRYAEEIGRRVIEISFHPSRTEVITVKAPGVIARKSTREDDKSGSPVITLPMGIGRFREIAGGERSYDTRPVTAYYHKIFSGIKAPCRMIFRARNKGNTTLMEAEIKSIVKWSTRDVYCLEIGKITLVAGYGVTLG